MLKHFQRLGGALFAPVLLFPFAGLVVALTIILKNPDFVGELANTNGTFYKMITVIEEGGWTVFRQLPLIFAIGLPIGLAKKAHPRACLAVLATYLTYNYFISAILTFWGPSFGVDFTQNVGGVSGLTTIAGIKTLDTSIVGAIVISGITIYIHNKFFDTKLPDFLGTFQGTTLVSAIAFVVMIPCAYITCLVWPKIQMGISSLQALMVTSGTFGVWLYTFLERILIPTGLHHFIYGPFIFGPAVVDTGIQVAWAENLLNFANSTQPLKELFPQGGFALHGNSKIFGCIGIALAMYKTARPEKKKIVSGLLIPAALTAALNWLPLMKNHSGVMFTQLAIGVVFIGIYYLVFKFLIEKYNVKTSGREDEEEETKLYTKADWKAKNGEGKETNSSDLYSGKAKAFLEAFGGKDNIEQVNNCATRLRISVKDEKKVGPDIQFKAAGAHGVVRNGKAFQVIVGLSVPQVRESFENLMEQN